MRSLGMLDGENDLESNIRFCSTLLKGVDLEATLPVKKVGNHCHLFCYCKL